MKYLIIGKNGQLGKEFFRTLSVQNKDVVALGHDEIELSDLESINKACEEIKPDVVINCAAYNLVDIAETDFSIAYKANTLGPYNLKIAQDKYKFKLVHYSTDYVFDGKKENALYLEEDKPNPLSQYAKSKYMGEDLLKNNKDTLVFRVSWVFGDGTQNFIYKVTQWAKTNPELKISTNEVSSPTSTKIIVETTLKSLDLGLEGLYHVNNSDYCSRYELAKYVLKIIKSPNIIYPATAEFFNFPAKRPSFSAMDNTLISKKLDIEIPDWQYSVKKHLENGYS